MNNEDNKEPPLTMSHIVGAVFGVALLQMLWTRAETWIEGLEAEDYLPTFFDTFFWIQVVSLSVSVVLLALIIYAIVGVTRVRREEEEYAKELYRQYTQQEAKGEVNVEWEQIKEKVDSENPSEWRLAILDADTLLERVVDRMQYQGETLSEKLQQVEKSDFTSIEAAWEAHKVRNKIAHEGSDFILTQREARRVIDLYEQVFREFHYI